MNKFTLQFFKGYPLLSSGTDIILLDTGTPTTIHNINSIIFCSERYSTTSNFMGLSIDTLSNMLGTNITTLLGTDILSHYNLLIDYQQGQLECSINEIFFSGVEKYIEIFMGVPVIELEINNQRLKFFLDTGAQLSYISKRFTSNYTSLGTKSDFYPLIGKFQTEYYQINTCLDNYMFSATYGNLPAMLELTLSLSGIDGIIGYDFFRNFKVMLNFRKQVLVYEKFKNNMTI